MLKAKTDINELYRVELERFVAARPRSMALHREAREHMPSGVPMAWMKGMFDHPPLLIILIGPSVYEIYVTLKNAAF